MPTCTGLSVGSTPSVLPSTAAPSLGGGHARLPRNWQSYSAAISMFSGIATQAIHHPFYTLKTHRQSPDFHWRTFVERTIKNPVRFLYKGILPRTTGVMPERVLGLQTWLITCRLLVHAQGKASLTTWFPAAIAAGAAAAMIGTPTELFMIQAQINGLGFRQVLAKGGILGLCPTMLRSCSFCAVFYCTRESAVLRHERTLGRPCSGGRRFGVGLLSGMLAAAVATPFDVVKTRFQCVHPGKQPPRGVINTMKNIVRQEGRLRLLRGLGPRLLFLPSTMSMAYVLQEKLETALLERLLAS